jgi:hypothetical protein
MKIIAYFLFFISGCAWGVVGLKVPPATTAQELFISGVFLAAFAVATISWLNDR